MRSGFSATGGGSSPRRLLGLRRSTSRKFVGASMGQGIGRAGAGLNPNWTDYGFMRRLLSNVAAPAAGRAGSADDQCLQLGAARRGPDESGPAAGHQASLK